MSARPALIAHPLDAAPQPSRPQRLRRRADFLVTLRDGKRARRRLIACAARENGLPHSRYGYAVGGRVGKAVVRNLVRRRLREILRALPIEAGYDVVITGFAPAADASFDELRREVVALARQCGVLGSAEGGTAAEAERRSRGER